MEENKPGKILTIIPIVIVALSVLFLALVLVSGLYFSKSEVTVATLEDMDNLIITRSDKTVFITIPADPKPPEPVEEVPEEDSKPDDKSEKDVEGEGEEDGEPEEPPEVKAEGKTRATQKKLNRILGKKGYRSSVVNPDGSVTFELTLEQHRAFMEKIAVAFRQNVREAVARKNGPIVTGVDISSDFSRYVVETKSGATAISYWEAIPTFFRLGKMYGYFNGTPVDNVEVDFVNDQTHESIGTANSRNYEEF